MTMDYACVHIVHRTFCTIDSDRDSDTHEIWKLLYWIYLADGDLPLAIFRLNMCVLCLVSGVYKEEDDTLKYRHIYRERARLTHTHTNGTKACLYNIQDTRYRT